MTKIGSVALLAGVMGFATDAAAENRGLSPITLLAVAKPASAEYNSMDDFLQQASLKNQKVIFHRTGDLNNDGLEDWAGILSKDKAEEAEEAPLIKLVVLIKLHSGHYAESASSMEVKDYYRFSPSSSFDFEIKNSSIYFSTSAHTCCVVYSSVYQFKLYNGVWRLVGKKTSSGNTFSGENPDDDFSKEEDVNMLTGLTISTVVRGNKKSEKRFINKTRVFLLKDFDFSGSYAAP